MTLERIDFRPKGTGEVRKHWSQQILKPEEENPLEK